MKYKWSTGAVTDRQKPKHIISISTCRNASLYTTNPTWAVLGLKLGFHIETNGEVNISHENTTMVVWICDGV